MNAAGWGTDRWLDHCLITADLHAAAVRANDLLELDCDRYTLEQSCEPAATRNAKAAGAPYFAQHQLAEDRVVEDRYGPQFDAAIA